MSSHRTVIAALISAAGACFVDGSFFCLAWESFDRVGKKPVSDIVPPISLKTIVPTKENASNGESADKAESEKEPVPEPKKAEPEKKEAETAPIEAVPPETAESEPASESVPESLPKPESEPLPEENTSGHWADAGTGTV